jgi:hypothetical protein
MTLEFTEQQWRIVDAEVGRPVEVVDPEGRHSHVLIRRDQFEKVRSSLEPASASQISLEIPPGIRRSQEAFWRDLPELLKQRKLHGRWACYYGDEQVGIANDDAILFQRCVERGLKRNEFYVGYIERHSTPPWEPTVLEESF